MNETMKKCTHSHKDLDDDLIYCPYCGQVTETCIKVCERCGNVMAYDHQFCGKCGSSSYRMEVKDSVTDVAGNVYNTVRIGEQIWMSQNMKVTVDREGKELKLGKDYWYPNGDESLVEEYGLLYTWEAAMRIAPQGWHVPSKAEWNKLNRCVRGQNEYRCGKSRKNIAKALASKTGWMRCNEPFTVGNAPQENNATGFSAVPAGTCYRDVYLGFGLNATFWSATPHGKPFAYNRILYYNRAYVLSINNNIKEEGYSVRCLRDKIK